MKKICSWIDRKQSQKENEEKKTWQKAFSILSDNIFQTFPCPRH